MGKIVTCAYTDVEMPGRGAGFEEGEEDAGGGAPPDVGICYAEDPGVVKEAEQ